MEEGGEERVRMLEGKEVQVSLHVFGVVLELTLTVRNVEEFSLLLKKEFALQEIRSTGIMCKV